MHFGKDKTLPEKKDSFSDGKQKRQPVLEAVRTGCLENKSSLSWQAGDRSISAGNCESADKASAPSCAGRGGRAFKKGVRVLMNGSAQLSLTEPRLISI